MPADYVPVRRRCDTMLRTLVRQRDACQRCGKPGEHVAHIITRRCAATRCAEDNVLWLCASCHDLFDSRDGVMSREKRMAFVDSVFGDGHYRALQGRANDGPAPRPLLLFWQSEAVRLAVRCRAEGLAP